MTISVSADRGKGPHSPQASVNPPFAPACTALLCTHLPADLADAATFLYLTAWRVGEMRTLEWRDVDLDGWAIRLRVEHSKK